jgi:hypothetical protein
MKITALSNHKPGILNNYIRITVTYVINITNVASLIPIYSEVYMYWIQINELVLQQDSGW